MLAAMGVLSACGGRDRNPVAMGGTMSMNPGGGDEPDAAADPGGGGTSSNGGSPNGGTANAGAANGGSTSSTGGNGTAPNIDALLDQVSAACEADCVAIQATECPPANVNRPTCELQCVVQTNTLGEFCLGEYAALVDCRAAGGYACVNDFPVAEANCPSEQQAFSMCTVDLGCKRYCAAMRDEGCSAEPLDTCIAQCLAGRDDYPMGCSYRYDALRQCQGTTPGECVDGELTSTEVCSYSVVSLAECLSDEAQDLCTGWCYAAEELGCPLENCATECPAMMMMDATCGMQFADMVDCGMFFGDVGCVDMTLMGTSICDSEAMAYTMCLNPPPPTPAQ